MRSFPGPPTVLIMAGTNDLGTVEPEQTLENLRQLHIVCHDAGCTTVALTVLENADEKEH